jgi:hypothetical protein
VKGLGELGVSGVASAIANAVFHATSRRIRDMPVRARAAPLVATSLGEPVKTIALEAHWWPAELADALGRLPANRRDDGLAMFNQHERGSRLLDLGSRGSAVWTHQASTSPCSR